MRLRGKDRTWSLLPVTLTAYIERVQFLIQQLWVKFPVRAECESNPIMTGTAGATDGASP